MKTAELEKAYEPAAVEARIYKFWVDKELFRANVNSDKKPYTIVIPPPNITGSLHMGHALDNTLQDVLIRFHRMLGYEACWIPGTDHAGIATQTVVEKTLKKEGKTRHDLGREAFLERVWEWREQYGGTIVEQLKRLGVSCDWSRLAFTMDPVRSRAVRESFIRLYEKGLIYRGKRLINWCPHCLTALSDLEVEHETQQGQIYQLRYPMTDGSGDMVIATTRPETILADVAVAVNPTDPRYADRIGKSCRLPLVDRELPIIADECVLTDFGTGALKITPAHDATDFEIGERHNLPQLVCLDEHGKLNELGGEYQGLDRFECRKRIVKALEAKGFLVGIEAHENNLGHCYRCHSVIEPYLSDQWFVKMKELAAPGIEAVHQGEIRFVPERFSKTYLSWMENIRDWCISRQIWWGHRIPVWTCTACGHQQAYLEDARGGCPQCASSDYHQDEDVLDTWFSSGLWPFSTFGWPESTPDLSYFYPTSVLVTGRDIIFLWVARMIMMGYAYLGKKPFSDVFIHATILTADGQRMSKSKGTGIDPLELIDKFGADATRFALLFQSTHSQDIRHNEERYEMSRNFCNKIWNAVRLCLRLFPSGLEVGAPQPTSRADRWILERCDRLVVNVKESMSNYAMDEAARELYEFFWNEFCDWYLEMIKPVFYGRQDAQEQARVAGVLVHVLDHFLRLAHPMMPFVTEELWSYLPGQRDPLITSPLPEPRGTAPDGAGAEMAQVMDLVRAIRNLRADFGVAPKQSVEVILEVPEAALRSVLESERESLKTLAGAEPVTLSERLDPRPRRALSQRVGDIEIFVPLPPGLDLGAEVKRLRKELEEATAHRERTGKKLENPNFTGKARPEVVEKERERFQEQSDRVRRVQERLAIFEGENG